ncbi:hypothetical protein M8C21_017953, partial [Ambrosia artemisiifolia]
MLFETGGKENLSFCLMTQHQKGMLSTLEKSTTDHEEAKRQLGPSRRQPSDDEEGGQTSVEAFDHSDTDLSAGEKTNDDKSSVKAHKDKGRREAILFFNRRLRQAVKNKDNNIACGVVQTRAKKGKQAIPVYDVSSSSPIRITRSKAQAIEISSEKPRPKNARPTKANKRKRAERTWNDGLEPRKQRKRSKLNEWLGIRTRSSPTWLTRCIKILSDEQRLAMKDLGFGRLLNLKMDGIPAKLGHYVVDNFDPGSLEKTLSYATLAIDVEVVHKILGTPIGGVSFNVLETRDAHDGGISKWKKKYPPSRFISPKQMVDMIEKESN